MPAQNPSSSISRTTKAGSTGMPSTWTGHSGRNINYAGALPARRACALARGVPPRRFARPPPMRAHKKHEKSLHFRAPRRKADMTASYVTPQPYPLFAATFDAARPHARLGVGRGVSAFLVQRKTRTRTIGTVEIVTVEHLT